MVRWIVGVILIGVVMVTGVRGESLRFDVGWGFLGGYLRGAEAGAFDDAGWEAVELPHDWSIAGGLRRGMR